MESFDPTKHIENANLLCEADESWPSFHDANVYTVNIWHGDLRPENDIWIGPQIEVSLGLSSLDDATPTAIVKLRFSDCDNIELAGFRYGGAAICELGFAFEERGFYTDGVTPLPPYINVTFFNFGTGSIPLLKFRCFKITALTRCVQHEPPYA